MGNVFFAGDATMVCRDCAIKQWGEAKIDHVLDLCNPQNCPYHSETEADLRGDPIALDALDNEGNPITLIHDLSDSQDRYEVDALADGEGRYPSRTCLECGEKFDDYDDYALYPERNEPAKILDTEALAAMVDPILEWRAGDTSDLEWKLSEYVPGTRLRELETVLDEYDRREQYLRAGSLRRVISFDVATILDRTAQYGGQDKLDAQWRIWDISTLDEASDLAFDLLAETLLAFYSPLMLALNAGSDPDHAPFSLEVGWIDQLTYGAWICLWPD